MPLTQLPPLDPSSQTFKADVDAFFRGKIQTFVNEVNALQANLNAIAWGGAYAIPCVAWGDFSTTAAGSGRLTIVGADQTQATSIYVNTIDSRGKNVQTMLSDIFGSASSVKAYLTIFAQGDPSKWISYRVTAWSYGGFATAGKIDVVCVGSSGANPISVGSSLIMQITRTGDKGDKGDNGTALTPIFHVNDTKPAGASGVSPSSGMNVRALNTIARNTIGAGASLSGNQVTLPAGTYRLEGNAPANGVGAHRAYLYNITNPAVLVLGSSEYDAGNNSRSWLRSEFTLSVATTMELRHWVGGTAGSLGASTGSGFSEIYSELQFEKLA